MLLVIDVGNTNTVIGIFKGQHLVDTWRIRSVKNITCDEFNILLSGLFAGSSIDSGRIKKTVVSSVVPSLTAVIDSLCRKYLNTAPYVVDAGSAAGFLKLLYDNPLEIGADRIANTVAAYDKYKTSLIIIDFGTATTFDAVSEKGEYLGGAISPGIMISSEALFSRAARLPRIELSTPPDKAIGTDTAGSMKSGILFGYAGLVDGIVKRIVMEMKSQPEIIATGGLAGVISDLSETIKKVEQNLTLEGLRIIGSSI